jgi:hypothetical protein
VAKPKTVFVILVCLQLLLHVPRPVAAESPDEYASGVLTIDWHLSDPLARNLSQLTDDEIEIQEGSDRFILDKMSPSLFYLSNVPQRVGDPGLGGLYTWSGACE